MGRLGVLGAMIAAALLLIAPLGAQGQGTPAPTKVGANGNAFTGGLSFTPADVTVHVGDAVEWTNTDSLVPHTATEDHGLWDLGGSYGATPANPPGFGPGTSVQRNFSAGTFNYYCRVHPTQMKGSVAVPVDLTLKHKHHRFRVIAVWSAEPPAEGQLFDVQKRKGSGAWKTVRNGTLALRGRFRAKKGQKLSFRARVRKAADSSAASDYSPDAKITVG